jgi:FAD/FMN-containing dehydrogenase
MQQIAGWGRQPVVAAEERVSETPEALCRGAVLSRGLGRSYGDASLPPPGETVVNTCLADRVLHFDPESAVLRAEAGLSLRELNRLLLARGFASPVHPGTQFVTLGGMVASDVHGKNHHVAGTFGEHVRALRMAVPDGRVLEVTEESQPDLFRATLGGMGLTGHVLEVEVTLKRIPSPWIQREAVRLGGIREAIERLREASRHWPYTVCWIDSTAPARRLGRGVLLCGRWAEPHEAPGRAPRWRRPVSLPVTLPHGLLGRHSIRLVNALYYLASTLRPARGIEHPQAFMHPLDGIGDWNRAYGPQGMVQYQCVVPSEAAEDGIPELLDVLHRHRGASPVTVMKDCGPEGRGMLSFPRPGVSITFDLPFRGARTQALVDELNERLIALGGRIYLAKDALTRPEHLRAMEPRLPAWQEVRRKWDPAGRLRSALSRRLRLDD